MNGKSVKEIAVDRKCRGWSFFRNVILPLRNVMKDSGLFEELTIQKKIYFYNMFNINI